MNSPMELPSGSALERLTSLVVYVSVLTLIERRFLASLLSVTEYSSIFWQLTKSISVAVTIEMNRFIVLRFYFLCDKCTVDSLQIQIVLDCLWILWVGGCY